LRHGELRLATPQRRPGGSVPTGATTPIALAHRKHVFHRPRPRLECLPFVQDRFETTVSGFVESMNSRLEQPELRF